MSFARSTYFLKLKNLRYLNSSTILLTEEDRLALSTDQQTFHSNFSYENLKSQRLLQQRRYNSDTQQARFPLNAQPSPPPALVPSSSLPSTQNQVTKATNGVVVSTTLPATSPPISQLQTLTQRGSAPQPIINSEQTFHNSNCTPSASPHTILVPSTEQNPPLQTPSIARHKGSQPYLSSHQPPGHLLTGSAQTNGDVANQRLKQPLNGPQKTVGQANLPLGFSSISPPPGSFYPVAGINFTGHSNIENLGITMSTPINLKLPPNRSHSRVSPQLPATGDMQGSVALSPATSTISLGSRSPMMRTAVVNNQIAPPFRGCSSPLNGAYTSSANQNLNHVSPTLLPHILANQNQQRVGASPVQARASTLIAGASKQFSTQVQHSNY